MTKAQAAQLQAQWKEQVDQPLCEHRNQEMKYSESGDFLTGHYHCTDCGELVTKKH